MEKISKFPQFLANMPEDFLSKEQGLALKDVAE